MHRQTGGKCWKAGAALVNFPGAIVLEGQPAIGVPAAGEDVLPVVCPQGL